LGWKIGFGNGYRTMNRGSTLTAFKVQKAQIYLQHGVSCVFDIDSAIIEVYGRLSGKIKVYI